MPLHPSLGDIALRLILSLVASAVIGLNREEHGSAAGLRTTMLVCLAAAISMVQVNLLLPLAGKTSSSFAVMDLMRLPLGILTGVGFIGAGAILRRNLLVRGVTTAATLWFVTVMGLCFGGGQIGLGIGSWVIAIVVLWALKGIERHLRWDSHVSLDLESEGEAPDSEAIRRRLEAAGLRVIAHAFDRSGRCLRLRWTVVWRQHRREDPPPAVIRELEQDRSFTSVAWQPMAGVMSDKSSS